MHSDLYEPTHFHLGKTRHHLHHRWGIHTHTPSATSIHHPFGCVCVCVQNGMEMRCDEFFVHFQNSHHEYKFLIKGFTCADIIIFRALSVTWFYSNNRTSAPRRPGAQVSQLKPTHANLHCYQIKAGVRLEMLEMKMHRFEWCQSTER